jgi:chromatin structure-remodeling complex subunit RSC9
MEPCTTLILMKYRTILDPNPKVGPRYIDLWKLYQRVLSEGGYDKASDTRGNKLAWRRIAAEFLPNNANIVQLAFQVKTAYYKNLA